MKQLISFQQNKVHYKNYLLLLIICLLAYWPLTFGVFSVKNDAIHYFLPYRFHISEAIRNGEMPFWSPYIYFGNPIYGDMQSGAWNPLVWLFSLISRYDITVFHYENLLYIFLAGIGMYKLTNRLVTHSHTALLIAVSYMLSGFMLNGQLINWLAAAAFFPFVVHYYTQCLRSSSLGYSIKTGIALFFLLTAGYPSFFIIASYILLLLFIITVIKRLKNKNQIISTWKKFVTQHLLLAIVFAGLSLPAIVSFIDLLPYYQRGSGTSYTDSITNSLEWQHLLSLIFPSSIKASDIVSTTDVTLRNIYPGIFVLLVLAVFPPKWNKRNILLLSLAVFALLFSLGDATPVRKLCFNIIPLMDTFRHPSQVRLFFIFSLLLLAAPGLRKILDEKSLLPELRRLKTITWISLVSILLISILAFFDSSILKQFSGFSFSGIKQLIENISLADAVFINGILQIFFLAAFLLWIKYYYGHKKILSFLWIANLFILAQFILPVTFVSQTSPKEINTFIQASPKGFPVNGLEKPLAENSKGILDHFDEIALTTFYNKKIGISRVSNSPAFLNEQDAFLKSDILYNYVASRPVAYIADSVIGTRDTALLGELPACNYAVGDLTTFRTNSCSNQGKALIKNISANCFEIETDSPHSSALLVLTQSYHHYWKVWVNNNPSLINKTNMSFMSTVSPRGHNTIIFKFIPSNTIKALWVMLATVLLLIIAGTVSLIRKSNFKQA